MSKPPFSVRSRKDPDYDPPRGPDGEYLINPGTGRPYGSWEKPPTGVGTPGVVKKQDNTLLGSQKLGVRDVIEEPEGGKRRIWSPEHNEERVKKTHQVLHLMVEEGLDEYSACKQVGIHRQAFRFCVLRTESIKEYAAALEAVAIGQVMKIEEAIDDMRRGYVEVKDAEGLPKKTEGGDPIVSPFTPEMARVEIQARQWNASRIWRPMWGDKLDANVAVKGVVINISKEDAEL